MNPIFTKSHLLEALKKAHTQSKKNGGPDIGYTYKSLLEYEKKGIIPRGGTEIEVSSANRFYTRDEIDAIVRRVKDYKNGR